MMKDAYRTNTHVPAREPAHTRRALDPFRPALHRLALLGALAAPLVVAMLIASRVGGDWHFAIGAVGSYVLITLFSFFPLIGVVEDKTVSPRATVLAIAYGPLSVLMLLGHWVIYGRFIPDFWKEPKKGGVRP